MNLGKILLTPFLPEDNTYVSTRKQYIYWCFVALGAGIILLTILTALMQRIVPGFEILLDAIGKIYCCGFAISLVRHLISWKDIPREKETPRKKAKIIKL